MADPPAFPVGAWVRYTGPNAYCDLSRMAPGALGRIVEHPNYGPVVRFFCPTGYGPVAFLDPDSQNGIWLHWDIQGTIRLALVATTPTEEELAQWTIAILSL